MNKPMDKPVIRLTIADDHQIVREGLRNLLAAMGGIEICCELADGDALLRAVMSCGKNCNLFLVDLSMPQGGIEMIRKACEIKNDVRILVLSMHNDSALARQAMQTGARGYVTKDCNHQTLMNAIHTVADGGKFIDPALIDNMDKSFDRAPHDKLSAREKEILKLLIDGQPLNHIAELLGISAKTVSAHKGNLMVKLEVDNYADLLRYAFTHRLN